MLRKPRLVAGVKGHNMNDITMPGSPTLWARSFTNSQRERGFPALLGRRSDE